MNIAPRFAADARSILIGGARRGAETGRVIDVLDPGNGEAFTVIAAGGAAEIDAAVISARAAADGAWGRMEALQRGRLLIKLAELILAETESLALIECRDTGKPLRQARSDIEFCARYFEFYGSAADKLMGETIPFREGFTVMTLREPHGVTGHIIPWNYPAQIMGRSVAAALAAGNACVVKPAEDASLSTIRVAELALEAGLPAGAFNVVTGYGKEAGAALAAHPGLDHISFTGSPGTGASVQAAAAMNNISVTMELGGKSPQIVFADADIEAAIPSIIASIIQHAGQTCSAGSRLLAERPVWDQVMARLGPEFSRIACGPGLDDPACGPLINARQRDRVVSMTAAAKAAGVPVIAEGTVMAAAPRGGFYAAPVLFGPVAPMSDIAQQEVFGPVLAATPFSGEDEAVALANGTAYGLVAGVWTRDGGRQMRMVRRLRCGQVFVNNFGAAGGVELPFGGVRRSGFGREKGLEGMKSFTVLKTAAFRHG